MEPIEGKYVWLDPPCAYCEHRTQMGQQDTGGTGPLGGWTCSAYPEGIPTGILRRQISHTNILPNQTGSDTYVSKVYHGEIITFKGQWKKIDKGGTAKA